MKIYETAKFQKQRRKLKSEAEKAALREAVRSVVENPLDGKKLKGEFKELRSFRYSVERQERRLIYQFEPGTIYLLSFGPREGAYN